MKFELHEKMSPQEQFQRLLDGEALHLSGNLKEPLYIKMSPRGEIFQHSEWSNMSVDISKSRDVYLAVKPKWYEEIPEIGRLVWYKSSLYLVHRFSGFHVSSNPEGMRIHVDHCRPLENEEIKAFLVEE